MDLIFWKYIIIMSEISCTRVNMSTPILLTVPRWLSVAVFFCSSVGSLICDYFVIVCSSSLLHLVAREGYAT